MQRMPCCIFQWIKAYSIPRQTRLPAVRTGRCVTYFTYFTYWLYLRIESGVGGRGRTAGSKTTTTRSCPRGRQPFRCPAASSTTSRTISSPFRPPLTRRAEEEDEQKQEEEQDRSREEGQVGQEEQVEWISVGVANGS
jgi:hypothetical protein